MDQHVVREDRANLDDELSIARELVRLTRAGVKPNRLVAEIICTNQVNLDLLRSVFRRVAERRIAMEEAKRIAVVGACATRGAVQNS